MSYQYVNSGHVVNKVNNKSQNTQMHNFWKKRNPMEAKVSVKV